MLHNGKFEKFHKILDWVFYAIIAYKPYLQGSAQVSSILDPFPLAQNQQKNKRDFKRTNFTSAYLSTWKMSLRPYNIETQ